MPKTTSSRPVIRASKTAQSPCTSVLRVRPRVRIKACRSAVRSAGSSIAEGRAIRPRRGARGRQPGRPVEIGQVVGPGAGRGLVILPRQPGQVVGIGSDARQAASPR